MNSSYTTGSPETEYPNGAAKMRGRRAPSAAIALELDGRGCIRPFFCIHGLEHRISAIARFCSARHTGSGSPIQPLALTHRDTSVGCPLIGPAYGQTVV